MTYQSCCIVEDSFLPFLRTAIELSGRNVYWCSAVIHRNTLNCTAQCEFSTKQECTVLHCN